MFVRTLLLVVLSVFLWATFARSSDASGPEERYVVQPADTLWSIAATRYGDPREGVYELRRRNKLDGSTIVPGEVLVLP
ncbi:MAG: LysM peptidoglycan-binding domain-containing protein [Actinobacteria bacterium]|nr:LysM peptidoglycan-binding domain-containing protein [Actinomycetota bacterium]